MQKHIIAIIGPTAIGKTARAITLANHFNTEIISADSRQFYKEMNIGTAVPSKEELQASKHHFIQQISIEDHYSVGDFEREAIEKLTSLFKRNDVVIVVGGSALFMDAILYGLDNFPKVKPGIRESLNSDLQSKGIGYLQAELKKYDPEYFNIVDLDNPHRLIRALEICLSAHKPYSSFLGKKKQERSFNITLIGIQADREVIYDRINKRVDLMIDAGLVEEAKALHHKKNLNALNTVGYKELFNYFEEKCTLSEAIEEIKKNTRRFAKRQLTWYRKNEAVTWLPYDLQKVDFIKAVKKQKKKYNGV